MSASTEPATNLCGTAEPCFAAAKASPLVAQLYLCNPAAAAMAAKCFNYQKSVFQGGDFLQHLWCMVCIRASNTNGGVHAAYLSWEGSHEKAATWFCTPLQGKAGHILNLHPTLSLDSDSDSGSDRSVALRSAPCASWHFWLHGLPLMMWFVPMRCMFCGCCPCIPILLVLCCPPVTIAFGCRLWSHGWPWVVWFVPTLGMTCGNCPCIPICCL